MVKRFQSKIAERLNDPKFTKIHGTNLSPEQIKMWDMHDMTLELRDFLKQYNGYDVVTKFNNSDDEYEDLCIGKVLDSGDNVRIYRDFFTEYPSLTHNYELGDWVCVLKDLEYPEPDVVRVIREDGEIYIKGLWNKYRAKTFQTVDIVPKDILGYGRKEFVDEIWSKNIDGKEYFVIDFFRAKKHKPSVIRAVISVLGMDKYPEITKTMFIRKTEKPEEYEVGIWDIEEGCPLPDRE